MTQRERQAKGGASDAPLKEVRGPDRTGPVLTTEPAAPSLPPWEELFRTASPEQQLELLALARRQGLLYAHQLPPHSNGSHPPAEGWRQLLMRLLAGQTDNLDPLRVPPAPPGEAPLDELQREAVGRALETPDVCLIQGLPGTGKSHVISEIITRATARGERILLVAPNTEALDRVLETVGSRDMVCAIRCLGRDERPEALAPAVRALTFSERARSFQEHSLECAGREVQKAEERLAGRDREEALWPHLDELAGRLTQLGDVLQAILKRRSGIPALVEADAEAIEQASTTAEKISGDLIQSLRRRDETLAKFEDRLKDIRRQLEEKRREHEMLNGQLNDLRPLIVAKQQKRWWTGSWWWATIQGNVLVKGSELQAQIDQIEKALKDLDAEVQTTAAEQEQARTQYQTDRQRVIEAETVRRQSATDDEEAALRQERRLVQDKWHCACQEMSECDRPASTDRPSVTAAREQWQRNRSSDEERLIFARQWADCLRQVADTLPSRLLGYVNLVAATTTGLPFDEHFGDASARTLHFDLLILDRAHEMTESEFFSTARRARRWVLVGEPTPDRDDTERSGRTDQRGSRQRAALPTSPVFARLWRHLHCDPRRLPYRWQRDDSRLVCHLRPLSEGQRLFISSERVADSPQIELRIAAPPGREPFLAEVVFPAATSLAEAKTYIFRELAELPASSSGHSFRWHEDSERVLLRLADIPATNAVSVVLTDGVCELVTDDSHGLTCCIQFDRRTGWSLPNAEKWAREFLGVRDLGRTVQLVAPHRMQPSLAAVLSHVLFRGDGWALPNIAATGATAETAFEFVAVPPYVADRRGGSRLQPVKGGAGLETDLSDPPHNDRLPSEFRGALPNHGLVNYMEATAVVRALERLDETEPLPAVITLYAAQAELIRLLMARSPKLANRSVPRVDVPAAFREQDFETVFVSLTRSHSHRAVTLGEGPALLTVALTRARRRLVVFGDVGTMARRAQGSGSVDHLDETAAGQERDIVVRLLDLIHDPDSHRDRFAVGQGILS